MKSQRDAFFEALYKIAFTDKDVLLISADMSAPALDVFRKDLAQQYIDVGIAEQQAIVLAAGLALEGKRPYAYAIAPFITLRCYEQIRIDLGAMNLPVTIVGVGAGMSYDDSGPTHHTVDDLTCIRTVPNLWIYNCTDHVMAAAMARITRESAHPCYVRLDRQNLHKIYDENCNFADGMTQLRKGEDAVILATGNMVHNALDAATRLERQGFNVSVIDIYRLPLNQDLLCQSIKNVPQLFAIEEHNLQGGFSSCIAETLVDNSLLIPLKRIGCDFSKGYCYNYGGRDRLQKIYGLDTDGICKTVESVLGGK